MNRIIKFKYAAFITLMALSACNNKPEIEEFINTVYVSDSVMMVMMGVDYFESVAAINTNDGIVVVDAGTSPTLTKKYRAIIEKEFSPNKIVKLINTHSHNDHTGGNCAFNDVEIIGHQSCVEEMKRNWSDPANQFARYTEILLQINNQLDTMQAASPDYDQLVTQRFRYEYALEDMKTFREPCLPNRTFYSDTTFSVGDKRFELYYFGNAHSESDIMIYLPGEKILFSGDLFFEGGRPSIYNYESNEVERWKRLLETLIQKDILTIVQGHGLLLDKSDLENFYKLILARAK